MKLRIRFESRTKVLSLEDGTHNTIGHVKNAIQDLVSDLQIPPSASFDLSLNGRTSLGRDSAHLSEVGVVSGDLIKIFINHGDGSDTTVAEEINEPVESVSVMSVAEEPTTSNVERSINEPSLDSETKETSEEQSSSVHVPRPGPLLLQDYIDGHPLPNNLSLLYNLPSVENDFHALCVVLHNLMLESGFNLQATSSDEPDIGEALRSFVVSLEYNHPGTHALQFSITCNPLGPFILVNGLVRPCVNTEEQILTLQIKAVEFVEKFNFSTKPSDGSTVYRNLSKLSRLFKETIAYPALDNMRAELKLPPLYGFLSLFPELLIRISSHLDASSLCALSQTCRRLAEIANDDILWRALYIHDFASHPNNTTSWKEMYKQQYQKNQIEERQRIEREREFEFIIPINRYPDIPVPYPGQPTGMLGGDYDMEPSFPYGPFGGRGPNPAGPMRRPRLPGPGNPLPGSRFDPMDPFGGGFRPGRGGGMWDDDGPNTSMGLPHLQGRPRNRRGFGGGGGFGGFM